MDSFELTKISGAVLAALLLIVAPRTLSNLGGEHHAANGKAVAGYDLPLPATEVKADAASSAAAAFDPAAVVKLVTAAKPENGEAIYKRCSGCHTNDKAAKSGAAPSFWGVVGRKKGAREDFGGYSDAMKAQAGNWTYADLAAFLHNPKAYMPGTKMAVNIADNTELADLLSYLRTLSDSPVPLP